jgi:hypothetical protein
MHGGIDYRIKQQILSLSTHSWMRMGIPGGNELSEPVPLHRGVRQGDPASPLLFNIFINDLLTNCEAFGVQVPWVPDERDPTKNRCLSGLMFADDVVLLAPTPEKLQQAMHQVGQWADRWEMRIGAKKCGVIAFYADMPDVQVVWRSCGNGWDAVVVWV